FGIPAAICWLTRATIPGLCRLISGTRTSSTRFATPRWRQTALETFGRIEMTEEDEAAIAEIVTGKVHRILQPGGKQNLPPAGPYLAGRDAHAAMFALEEASRDIT